jgi:preprotein translocase subunit SecG
MTILLTALHLLVCIFLILVVLLQTGKGADIAAAFGGSGSQTAFGARGAATLLTKLTTASAIMFMITCLALAFFANNGGRSVVSDEAARTEQEQTAPALPTPAPESETPPPDSE